MKENLEIEFKSLLSPFDFNRLRESFFVDATLNVQMNSYYDTPDGNLQAQKSSARIRIVNDKALFTLKVINEEGYVVEYEVLDDYLEIDDPRIQKILSDLGFSTDLVKISSSRTHRFLVKDSKGEWCLDHTEFTNQVDFEIEYELTNPSVSPQEGLQHFLDFLQKYSLSYQKGPSKFQRSLIY